MVQLQLYRYFVSQSTEFCLHNPLSCSSTNVYCCKCIFRYRLSPESFGYALVHVLKYSAGQRDGCAAFSVQFDGSS